MRLSRYTLRVDLDKQTYLLYNTYSGSLAYIDSESDPILQKSLQNLKLDADDQDIIDELEEAKILRKDDVDEDSEIREWYHEIRKNEGRMHITVLTTNACNMACAYCFEGEALRGSHMPPHVARALISWTRQKLIEIKPNLLSVRFFGGEPFVNPKGLLDLARNFRQLTEETQVNLHMMATTNGSHLPREVIEELVQLGLKTLRVTFDGDEERHNEKRPLKNGKNSFQTIWKNLEAISDLVQFDLAVNAEPEDVPSISQLLPKLGQSLFKNSIRQLNIKPVNHFSEALHDLDLAVTPQIAHHISRWRGLVTKAGFKVSSALENKPCQIHQDTHFVVDPKGDLYPCESAIGRTSAVIGSIFLTTASSKKEEAYEFFRQYSPLDHPKCSTCAYFPVCGGGCRLATFSLDRKEETDIHCPIELHQALLPSEIRKQFLNIKETEERKGVTQNENNEKEEGCNS